MLSLPSMNDKYTKSKITYVVPPPGYFSKLKMLIIPIHSAFLFLTAIEQHTKTKHCRQIQFFAQFKKIFKMMNETVDSTILN